MLVFSVMDDDPAGPSGIKRPRKCTKTWEFKRPLTEKELEDYLNDSDDDIVDPDFELSDSESAYSENSEDEETENPTLEDLGLDITDPETSLNTQIPTPMSTHKTPAPSVIWDTKEAIPKKIPFTRQRELLVQLNGKLQDNI